MKRLRALKIGGLGMMMLVAAFGARPSWAQGQPLINVLYNFTETDQPAFEYSSLIQATDGDFYGVAALGGAYDFGYVYKVSRTSGRITHLHDFAYTDGATPRGTLIQAADGFLYGTTEAGGASYSDYCFGGQFYQKGNCGVIFKVSLAGAFTKLHDFYTVADGYQAGANTGLIQASDGNFYGTALVEYPTSTLSIFKMTPAGTVSVLYQTPSDETQGYLSQTGLLQGKDGYLYGTASGGGAPSAHCPSGCGTVFRISLAGVFQLLYSFTGTPASGNGDGADPWGKLIQGQDGNFYGTTFSGGTLDGDCYAGSCGTVYKITPSGTETVVHVFTASSTDGEWPQNAGLEQAADGSLYGVTGGNPYGAYGPQECYIGETADPGCGTVYKIDTAGNFTQLFSFAEGDSAYGLWPMSSLVFASDGNLYGTCIDGGGTGPGVVFRVLLNPATPIVAIYGTSPPGGLPGDTLIINGVGFTGASQVTFPTGAITPIPFTFLSDSQLSIVVPAAAVDGAIGVTAPRGTAYSPNLFYLPPIISSLSRSSGKVGSSVTVNGAHFDGITSVTLGGVTATWTYTSSGTDTAIIVKVPKGASTGPIVVANPGGSAVSPTFTVTGKSRH